MKRNQGAGNGKGPIFGRSVRQRCRSPHSHGKISGGGEMAELVRAHDWTDTPLGAIDDWPETLLSCLNTILASRFPMALAWGPEMLQFYNDAYRPLMAEKHPHALGRPAAESWEEAWYIVGPELEARAVARRSDLPGKGC